jgi:dihydrofolate reductase
MIASFFSVDQKGGLGNKGSLPWPNDPEDMKWFKETTKDHIVVMGRRTWDDPKMPKPLPNRINAVITNRYIPGVHNIKGDIVEGIKRLRDYWPNKNIFIIGGAELIEQTKDLCDFAYIAHRKGAYYTDVRVNIDRYLSGMRIMSSCPSTDKNINFCTYKNIDLFRPVL